MIVQRCHLTLKASQITVSSIVFEQLVQAYNRANIKTLHYWAFCRGIEHWLVVCRKPIYAMVSSCHYELTVYLQSSRSYSWWINSQPSDVASLRHTYRWSLIQITIGCLIGTQPLFEIWWPILLIRYKKSNWNPKWKQVVSLEEMYISIGVRHTNWTNTHCIRPVSDENITLLIKNIRK